MEDRGDRQVMADAATPATADRKGHPFGTPFWLYLGAVPGALAVLLEGTTHIAAGNFFDPLPGPEYLAAYVFAILAPVFCHRALVPGRLRAGLLARLGEGRLLALCGALCALTVVVTAGATWMLSPILPFALPAVLAYGFGLLVWAAPLLLIASLLLWAQVRRRWRELGQPAYGPTGRVAIPTLLLSLALAVGLYARPVAAGAFLARAMQVDGVSRDHPIVRGLRLVRGEDAVLAIAYRSALPYWNALGYYARSHRPWPWNGYDSRSRDAQEAKRARRLYFLVTGRPFADAPTPWTVANQRPLDWVLNMHAEEMAGEKVGREVPGLSLHTSEAQGEVDVATRTAEYDWTLVFQNAGPENAEARADVLLPPGAGVHKVSLWINGEERPAAFAGNAQVRKAYREMVAVPVRQQRDPLLVTMPSPGKLFVQCAPVPPDGGKMKIRLGVTAPLTAPGGEGAPPSRALFTPPAFGQVNFDLPTELRHRFSLAGVAARPGVPSPGWAFGEGYARAALPSGALFAPPRLSLDAPFPSPADLLREGAPDHRVPVDLFVVVDTGREMGRLFGREERAALLSALVRLPQPSRVRFVDASRAGASGTSLVRSEDCGADWERFLRGARFVGGVDAVPALEAAVRQAAAGRAADPQDLRPAVLYVHGPAPDSVSDAAPVAEALKTDQGVLFVGVQLAPRAPDAVMERLALQPNARSLTVATYGGSAADAIRAAVAAVGRGGAEFVPDAGTRNPRQERLSLNYEATRTWYATGGFGEEAQRAAKRASAARLVTPLSGAVVLETQEDYERHGLDDGTRKKPLDAAAAVAPEGGTLTLLAVGLLTGAGVAWRRRRKSPPAPQ